MARFIINSEINFLEISVYLFTELEIDKYNLVRDCTTLLFEIERNFLRIITITITITITCIFFLFIHVIYSLL